MIIGYCYLEQEHWLLLTLWIWYVPLRIIGYYYLEHDHWLLLFRT